MSSGALDRSNLDSKDRAELATIAQAMGGKPLSRTRKSEIVDMILDLAGGGSDAPAESKAKKSTKSKAKDPKDSKDKDSKDAKSKDKKSSSKSKKDDANDDGDDGAAANGQYGFSFDPFQDATAERDAKAKRDAGEDSDADAKDSDDGDKSDSKSSDSKSSDSKSGDSKSDSSKSGDSKSRDSRDRDGKNRDSNDRGRDNRDGGRNRSSRDRNDRNSGDNRDGRDNNRDSNRDGGRSRNRNDRNNNDRNNNDRNKNNDRNRQQKNNDPQPEAGNRKQRRGRGRKGGGQQDHHEDVTPWDGVPIPMAGYLDLRDEGYGFLRVKGALPSNLDVYIPVKKVRELGLRRGDHLTGTSRPANRNEKNPSLLEIDQVNHTDPALAKGRPKFDELTPLFPDEKLKLERADDPTNMTARIVDLISPIGKGQRGLIVSPPKAGKTTIMKEIARSIELNNPECYVMVLLVDERPEEVTDMKRWLVRGEVVASTFDRPSSEHTAVAEIVIERAKRKVEMGEDVVIILDGITRLSRAYNLAAPATGRIMSGGVDSGALYPPKRFFGAARNVEEGGSLTILATALVETGSKMDEVIFEEFKGTGNMELRLDRRTAERRVYPAIDVDASSTRHEELLFDRTQLNQVWKLRRVLTGMANDEDNRKGNAAGLELLIDRLKTFENNDAFLREVASAPVG